MVYCNQCGAVLAQAAHPNVCQFQITMILIKAPSPDDLAPVIEDLETFGDFDHLDLGDINTLIMCELNEEAVGWHIGEPIAFDEQQGLCVIEYSTEALKWMADNTSVLSEYGCDPSEIMAFAQSF